jgi:hypothetical protein
MLTPRSLATYYSQSLYIFGAEKHLSTLCTPFKEAKSGDLLGVMLRYVMDDYGPIAQPLAGLLYKNASDAKRPSKFVHTLHATDFLSGAMARQLILLQEHDALDPGQIKKLSVQLGEYADVFHVLAMPHAAIYIPRHRYEDLYMLSTGTPFPPDDLPIVLLPQKPPTTSHELIETTVKSREITQFVNHHFPIPDAKFQDRNASLSPPEIENIDRL